MALPVCIQLFTLRDELEADARTTLRALADMGYNGVEVCGTTYDMSVAEFGEFCASVGLSVPSAHYSLETLAERGDELFGEFSAIGTKYFTVPYLAADKLPGGENYESTVRTFIEVSEKAKKYGIQLLYHNHDTEFKKHGGRYLLEILLEDCGAYSLRAEYDTCWIGVVGEDPAEYIRANASKCEIVHLKDYYKPHGGKFEREFRPIGYGNLDVPAVLDAANDAEANWLIVEQDSPSLDRDSLTCARMSIEYLKVLNK